jgi:hypothetical protein
MNLTFFKDNKAATECYQKHIKDAVQSRGQIQLKPVYQAVLKELSDSGIYFDESKVENYHTSMSRKTGGKTRERLASMTGSSTEATNGKRGAPSSEHRMYVHHRSSDAELPPGFLKRNVVVISDGENPVVSFRSYAYNTTSREGLTLLRQDTDRTHRYRDSGRKKVWGREKREVGDRPWAVLFLTPCF